MERELSKWLKVRPKFAREQVGNLFSTLDEVEVPGARVRHLLEQSLVEISADAERRRDHPTPAQFSRVSDDLLMIGDAMIGQPIEECRERLVVRLELRLVRCLPWTVGVVTCRVRAGMSVVGVRDVGVGDGDTGLLQCVHELVRVMFLSHAIQSSVKLCSVLVAQR